MRPHVIKLCYDSCVRYFNDIQQEEDMGVDYYNPNVVYGTDVLDTVPEAGPEDITFSEREVVIYLLNKRFKWPIPLKHPRAYYLDCDMELNQATDINRESVDLFIKDTWQYIIEFNPTTIGEEKYLILKLQEMVKTMKHNWRQHLLCQKGLEDINNG